MTDGMKEYLWKDDEKKKNPKYKVATEVSAAEYVACLMDWIEQIINDPQIFPSDVSKFPKDFKNTVRKVFVRMFRVYGHLYACHFAEIIELGFEKHLNTAFKHFMLFAYEFNLLDDKETESLVPILQALKLERPKTTQLNKKE